MWLFLDGTIEAGQAVTLSYRDPTGGNDAQALQDSAGNDAASFTDHAVTNSLRDTTGGVQNAEPETDPLTVSVASAPERHDGESGFEVRLAFSEAPGTLSYRTVTVGGQALVLDGAAATDADAVAGAEAGARADTMARWLRHDEDEAEAPARSMEGREVLLASAFSFSAGGDAGRPRFGAWGRFATGSFEGEDGDVALSGDVTSVFLGADVAAGRWLGGLAVGLSEGEGPFRYTGDAASNRETGEVESSLTALYPYVRLSATERLDLWAVAGFGSGTMTITEEGGRPLETDIAMRMGVAGAKGEVLAPPPEGGLALSVRSDVLWVRMDSDGRRASAEDGGNLAAADADVTRLRLIVEGSRAFAVGAAATLTPSLEVGLRHDGGDAETGTGVELGGRIAWAGPGVTVEAAARGLVAHEDAGYEEWGGERVGAPRPRRLGAGSLAQRHAELGRARERNRTPVGCGGRAGPCAGQ